MTKKELKQELKNNLISVLEKYILKGLTLDELSNKARLLCKLYFKNADEVFLNTFVLFAEALQSKYFAELVFDECLEEL